jgi:hypothetical protein
VYFISDSVGWAAGNNGIIIKTNTGGEPIGIKRISNEVPETYVLSQNYPNPFNPETIINFQLPKSGNVKLIVYDILGKEVATLVDQHLNSGSYDIEWNASHLSSGVYFYRLITSDFSETKKMILMK